MEYVLQLELRVIFYLKFSSFSFCFVFHAMQNVVRSEIVNIVVRYFDI